MKRVFWVALVGSFLSLHAYGDVVVIVNFNSEMSEMSKRDVARVFLAKTNRLPSGEKANPIEPAQSQSKKLFYAAVTDKNEVQLRSYWATLIFTGKGRPPKQVKESREVLEFVRSHKGAIGYIEKSLVDDTVKTVMVIQQTL